MSFIPAGIDPVTKLFGQPTMDALSNTMDGIAESVAESVAQPLAVDARDAARTMAANGVPPRCRVSRSSDFTAVPNDSVTIVPFNTEDYDTDGMHNNGTNNSRINVPWSGFWTPEGSGTFAGSSSGTKRRLVLFRNGVNVGVIGEASLPLPTGECAVKVDTGTTFYANAGDYFELGVLQDSGGTLDLKSNRLRFEMRYAGRAAGSYDQTIWDPAPADRGFGLYGSAVPALGTTDLAEKWRLVSDPVHGPARQVWYGVCTPEDDFLHYPRIQLGSINRVLRDQVNWFGFSFLIPSATEVRSEWHNKFQIHEIFAGEGGSNNRMLIIGDELVWCTDRDAAESAADGVTGCTARMTINRDQWYDVVGEMMLSTNPAVGYVRYWVDSGDGYEAVTFTGDVTQYFYDTAKVGNNDGQFQASLVKISYADSTADWSAVHAYFHGHRIGSSFTGVDPQLVAS